jgi:hypothetical protein
MNWAKGGIVFFFAVMIAIWLVAAWFLLANPHPRFLSGRFRKGRQCSLTRCDQRKKLPG